MMLGECQNLLAVAAQRLLTLFCILRVYILLCLNFYFTRATVFFPLLLKVLIQALFKKYLFSTAIGKKKL